MFYYLANVNDTKVRYSRQEIKDKPEHNPGII
mgnify:CR=1 FL=1